MRKPAKSALLGSTSSTTAQEDPNDSCAPARRDRHGFRGVPGPATFDFDQLADSALLNEIETAAILRLSTNTLTGWRQQPGHALQWLALPNGFIRYTVGAIRAFLALGQPRKPKPKSSPAPAAINTKKDAAPPQRRVRHAKADDSTTQEVAR
jgi:hypothetical protein